MIFAGNSYGDPVNSTSIIATSRPTSITGASSSEVPGASYARAKSRRDHRKAGPTRRGNFAQTPPMVVDIILIAFVSRRRATFLFGPIPTEVSTRRYGASKKRARESKEATRGPIKGRNVAAATI